MPPDSILELHSDVDDRPTLSDQNVAILCQIVQQAETQSNVESHPFRALFSAYDEILPSHGIDPAHDQVYLRFLFKLGGKRQPDETLFETFERFLKELEIQLEFVSNEEALAAEENEETHLSEPDGNLFTPGRRLRRASFSAVHDLENEPEQAALNTFRSHSSQWAPTERSHKLFGDFQKRKITTFLDQRRSRSIPAKTTLSGRDQEDAIFNQSERNPGLEYDRATNVSGASSHRIGAKLEAGAQSPVSLYETVGMRAPAASASSASPANSTNSDETSFQKIMATRVRPASHLYHPSRSQLLRDVDTFQHYRVRAVAHDIVDRWCDAALQARNHREHLKVIAVARDTEILLHQAFEHWRMRLHARKQAAETERYFARLQYRASRARDLYLLTKAFSHWRLSSEDERRRRVISRQKVVAVKYFHAWRDYALKRQNDKRDDLVAQSFNAWNARCNRYLNDLHVAQAMRERQCIKGIYWKWFWTFCERRAPEWHDRKLIERLLIQWRRKSHQCVLRTEISTRLDASQSCQRAFRLWVSRSRMVSSALGEAHACSSKHATSSTLATWVRASRFRPIAAEAANLVDWRIASTTFVRMVHLVHLSNQASKVDRLRNVRLRWTEWNDNLRCSTLQHRLDDRFLIQMLYRWVIAGRLRLLYRLIEQRLRDQQWLTWKKKLAHQVNRHQLLLETFRKRKNISLLSKSMEKWTSQYRNSASFNQTAQTLLVGRVSSETWSIWSQALQRRRQLDSDVSDVREYFLLRQYCRRWQKMTQASKNQKRRNAYVAMRRAIKMRLAAEIITKWHNKTNHVVGLIEESSLVSMRKSFDVGTEIFDIWSNAVSILKDREQDAVQRYQHRLMVRFMGRWHDNAEHHWTLAGTAGANHGLQRQKSSFICLRRMRLRLIGIGSLQGRAENLKRDYEKRLAMNKLRLWSTKATARSHEALSVSVLPEHDRKDRSAINDQRPVVTESQSLWPVQSAYDPTYTKAQDIRTPIPGYLSTPSKRAARARALVQSTTPMGTPIQSRLRAQFSETPQVSARSIFAQSLASRGEGNHSTLEDSTPVPRSSRGTGEG